MHISIRITITNLPSPFFYTLDSVSVTQSTALEEMKKQTLISTDKPTVQITAIRNHTCSTVDANRGCDLPISLTASHIGLLPQQDDFVGHGTLAIMTEL